MSYSSWKDMVYLVIEENYYTKNKSVIKYVLSKFEADKYAALRNEYDAPDVFTVVPEEVMKITDWYNPPPGYTLYTVMLDQYGEAHSVEKASEYLHTREILKHNRIHSVFSNYDFHEVLDKVILGPLDFWASDETSAIKQAIDFAKDLEWPSLEQVEDEGGEIVAFSKEDIEKLTYKPSYNYHSYGRSSYFDEDEDDWYAYKNKWAPKTPEQLAAEAKEKEDINEYMQQLMAA